LVGGHCIGVDPYYLAHKAIRVGYQPEIILSGRRINDGMGKHISDQVAKLMIKKRIHLVDSNVLIMGLAFKENTPDLRNTGVINLVETLESYDCNVDVYDPWVDKDEALHEFGIKPINKPIEGKYDAVLLAVSHDEFKELSPEQIRAFGKDNHVLYDIKYLLDANEVDGRL
jgi:UDP-N-acetyl-D-galactosamine dehydrogenase